VDFGLADRVALVTGGSQGIGRGIAEALIAEGAQVAISSRSAERIEATAGEIGAHPFVHDSNDLDHIPHLVYAVTSALGSIDILVTNTGGPPLGPDPLGFADQEWEDAYRHLVRSPIALVKHVIPGMREGNWGRILNVASTTVREPSPVLMLSNSHRAAAVAAFKTLARHVAADGVTVNSILPGRIATNRLFQFGPREMVEQAARSDVPAQRLGTVEELGAVAAFLCSAPASYVTGVALPVDGGLLHGI
jgi:3-oxoacyl-[acyl-carrier protein] reductase